ncbi:L-rhamnose mutarotase [Mameliella sediminis]|uniref:L-rhamnose mutarotase n=1 Tax=Mameliella sediminis TaxID=2836866 RepID=UPI001C47F246|nr:L-rhamnose mutarotase [Mameliella sediminis]MBV7396854.1 L-rhamnose mutarotase [Mameliella sediminis]MBY6116188.1 L-rhamnose mutarotase [Antarctobacter heliothermus]MBY6146153.1 L-rhamnose mutarotase [Mameliella alba]MCA0955338.1 L-rhamnose mutarotase [Mameliella alba]
MTLYRRAWTMQLREGAEAAYDDAHAAIWPELKAQMTASGIVRFFLYRSGRTIFAFQERDQPFGPTTVPPSDVTVRWWRTMAPLMVTEGANHRPVHHTLREVFALDTTSETET